MAILSGALLGLVVGVRHAFEPDHLAAVSTMVPECEAEGARGARRAVGRGLLLGAMWGLGHTLALVAAAVGLVAVGAHLSEGASRVFELAVAGMLIALGVRAIVRAWRLGSRGTVVAHAHRDGVHAHATSATHVHLPGGAFALRPLLVGTLHGLAGSGALTVAVAARLASPSAQLGYVMIFGVGATLGMALVTALGAVALSRIQAAVVVRSQLLLGALSIAIGVWWGVPLLAA